jgi:N-acetylglucosamine-6-phosphate deacetylase
VKLAGVPLEEALRAASLTPAAFLGLEDERGSLTRGSRADMVALTDGLEVIAVWVGGEDECGS